MAESEWEEVLTSLSKLSASDTSDLCHALAEQICHSGVPAPDTYLKSLSLEEWWSLTGVLRKFLTISAKNDSTRDQMLESMKAVPEEQRKVIIEAATVHRNELHHRLLEDTTSISQSVLRDFDWQLKLVMSSDKLASINKPLLNVDLDLQDGAGNSRQVALELDHEELKKLLSSLEGCSKAVQQLTV
ncbi:COMM domain-containing protein 8-like [Babylonia areolata]|uniref:COMM domain-containing protein 8-like n=1 Tax=Babylonia areolata TaxID=304850 RepID=UPI003FD69508